MPGSHFPVQQAGHRLYGFNDRIHKPVIKRYCPQPSVNQGLFTTEFSRG